MGKRGRKRDLDREIRYWELLVTGVGTVEACRRVGVTRKTGYRWRSEMGGVIAKKHAAVSGRYLSLFERQRIASLRDRGASVRDIARRIGRSPSTVSRELRRNCRDWDDGYEPVLAHLRAHERAKRPKLGKIASSPWLAKTIQAKLAQHWSPEQIHLHLRAQHGTDPARTVCVESIYQALYRPTEDGLSRSLTRRLRTGRTLRRRQRRADRRSPRFGTAMRTIRDRAPEALDRTEPGHWEGDLIVGTQNRSAIGTLVERTSRFTILVHIPDDKTAETVTAGVVRALRRVPSPMRRSLAWDRGTEMADHEAISQATGVLVFFCDPGSPWQRPTNENTNGLLRQYFPKGTDLAVHTPQDLRRVQRELNQRPRKSLGGRTPAQVFAELSALLTPQRCDDR